MRTCGGGVAAAMLMSSAALATWGVRYEVNAGTGWLSSITIDVASAPRVLDFRITVYHDGMPVYSNDYGTAPARAPLRLCNSQKIQNFGLASLGDSLLSFTASVGTANSNALTHTQVGSDRILGTPNSPLSFASDSNYMLLNPRPERFETVFYTGKFRVGNNGAAATTRTIILTANSFAYPSAGEGMGGQYGASFVTSPNFGFGVAQEPATTIPAIITVGTQPPCPADFNGDQQVEDLDFAIFAGAYDIFECSSPSMPAGCPGDLNLDGFVDDTDFALFAAAYDALICP